MPMANGFMRYESTAHAVLQYYQSSELTLTIEWPQKSNCRHTCAGDTYKNYLRFILGLCAQCPHGTPDEPTGEIRLENCLTAAQFIQLDSCSFRPFKRTCGKLQTKINRRRKNENETFWWSIFFSLKMFSSSEYMMSIEIKIILWDRRAIL